MTNQPRSSHFTYPRRVSFAETDLAGVMHFSNYYRLMEEAEHAFLRSIDLAVVHPEGERTISWPRVATGCEFFAPAHFNDELALSLVLANVGDRSVTYEVEFLRDGKRIALGRSTAVCCEMTAGTFQPTSIPPDIRTKLEASKRDEAR
jgi:4-hydroxybenzoyl-CoA thioesterase/acyl-CoA thioester hydrolase